MDELDFIPMIFSFINRLQNGHIYIAKDANTLMSNNSLSLADNLGNAITNYQNGCNSETIRNLRYLINQAHAHGVVKIGSEVLSKLEEKEQRIFDLQNEIDLQKERHEKEVNGLEEKYGGLQEKHSDLSSDHVELQGRYKELKENVKKYYPKDYEDMFHE
jgi:hypothetical protein